MNVELNRIILDSCGAPSDVVITIECDCGNNTMLDEAGDFIGSEVFVYIKGIAVKNLRCIKMAAGCRERYRTTLNMGVNPPFVEVAHIAPRPNARVLETIKINIPTRTTKKFEMYPCVGYPNPNPYER